MTPPVALASLRLAGVRARRRVPRQVHPDLLKNAYRRELVPFVVDRVHEAMAPFRREIEGILNGNPLAARHDGYRRDAGESNRIRTLIEQARARMRGSLLTGDLDRLAAEFATKTATFQRLQLLRQTRAALGVDVLIRDRRLAAQMEGFVANNVSLIRGLTEEFAIKVEKSAMQAVQAGRLYTDYAKTLRDQFDFPEERATLIARDQIGKFYGQCNATRQRELGINHYTWRTSEDERVRDLHDDLNGKVFSFDDPPESGTNGERLNPGEPILCRCEAEPNFDDILGGDADSES